MGASVNNKCKAFTSLEQSKMLSKILPCESADFCWGLDSETLRYNNVPYPLPYVGYTAREYYVPCWTLSALLDILPMPTLEQDKADGELFWQCSIYNDEGEKLCEEYASDKVGACVDLITRLHELKRLDCLNCWRA